MQVLNQTMEKQDFTMELSHKKAAKLAFFSMQLDARKNGVQGLRSFSRPRHAQLTAQA